MSFWRVVFIFALVMFATGAWSSKYLLAYLFPNNNEPSWSRAVAAMETQTVLPHPTATPTATTRIPTQTPAPTPVPTSTAKATPVPTATIRALPTVRVTRTPVPTARPLPSPTAGVVTLARYWVGQAAARRGQTVAIGYVIDNSTGHTERVALGASLKPSRVLSWGQGEVDDRSHDVVAIVPPGVTTHERFFTLSTGIPAGTYDVAWGLRDAATGSRLALVSAPGAMQVGR